ncbi:MAG: winged helix-turn-helix domain-containing protein [bacterium]
MVESKVIRVDEEVWEKLQDMAEPFVDTPNSVLRKLLNMDEVKPKRRAKRSFSTKVEGAQRKRRKDGLSMKDCYLPLLKTLVKHGGRIESSIACKEVKGLVKDKIIPSDHELVDSGVDIRWRNVIRWARKRLVEDGLMKKNSPRGIWEISEEGRKFLQAKGSA